jgi:hypothetical protein
MVRPASLRWCGTLYSDGSIDVWSAVGRDEGHNGPEFSTPLRVSSVASIPPSGVGAPGDDFSWIIADGHYVHVGWGDSRNVPLGGGIQTWYARSIRSLRRWRALTESHDTGTL